MLVSSKTKRLVEWRPAIGKNTMVVMVEGFLQGDNSKKLWRSSAIESWENPKMLKTKNDGIYVLVGSINVPICETKGFPRSIIDQFRDGFPENWLELLSSLYNKVKRNPPLASNFNYVDNDFDFAAPPRGKTKSMTKAVVPYKSTPNNIVKTRSGRVTKPRQAIWANQGAVYDKDGNVIEVRNVSTKTSQSLDANQDMRKLCNSLEVNTPEASKATERSLVKLAKKPQPSKQKKTLVNYSPSDSDYDSIDDESLDEIEILEAGNTPILPSRRTTKHVNKKLRIFESSPEEDVEKKENERRKRSQKTTSKPDVASKLPKKSGPPPPVRGLALRKARDQLEIRPPSIDIDEPQPIIEYPASEMSFDMNENNENDVPKVRRWTAKEKQKFLEHLKLYNPVNDQDWEQVQSNKTDVPRTIEELKERAKELRWKPINSTKGNNAGMADGSKNISTNPITARPGTVAHLVQAEQFNQQYLNGQNKNFSSAVNHRKQMLADSEAAPLELSESAIDFVRTPDNPRRFRANGNLFNPSVMTANFSTSSMNDSSTSNASVSSPFVPPMDKTSRQRQQLHAYQTLRKTQKVTKKTGQDTTVFSEETTTTTMSFLVPQLPSRRPVFSNDLEETTENDDLEEQDDDDVFGETF